MVIGDFLVANHQVVRQHAADRFVEPAADRFVRHLEFGERLRSTGVHLGQRLFDEMHGRGRRVGLKVRAGPIALDGVAPLGNLPFEFDFGHQRRFRQQILTLWPVDLMYPMSTLPANAVAHSRAIGPPPVSSAR